MWFRTKISSHLRHPGKPLGPTHDLDQVLNVSHRPIAAARSGIPRFVHNGAAYVTAAASSTPSRDGETERGRLASTSRMGLAD